MISTFNGWFDHYRDVQGLDDADAEHHAGLRVVEQANRERLREQARREQQHVEHVSGWLVRRARETTRLGG